MIDDETLEAMARAHDAEDAAQKGEPSPWRDMDRPDWVITADDEAFRAERLACMRCAVEAFFASETYLKSAGELVAAAKRAGAL